MELNWRTHKSKGYMWENNPKKEKTLDLGAYFRKIFPIRMIDVNNETELGRAIRARRKAVGMTIAELASVVPCSPRLLSELERGQRGVSIAATFRLMQMLGLVMNVRGSEEGDLI